MIEIKNDNFLYVIRSEIAEQLRSLLRIPYREPLD